MKYLKRVTTGIHGLDTVIDWLRIGDNVVWQVDDIKDYRAIVTPFVEKALEEDNKVIYMRFAQHEPLFKPRENLIIYKLDSSVGFESFSTQVHTIITDQGEGAFYVFDSLSDLLSAWATDLMIGNFFLITCPYLFELKTIAMRPLHGFAKQHRYFSIPITVKMTFTCSR